MDESDARLVFDKAPETPERFRSSADELAALPGIIDLAALRELRASGSGTFDEKGLAAIAGRATGTITVVDLRLESHGYVNGEPVTWLRERNWGNLGLTHDEVLARETELLTALRGEEEVARVEARDGSPAPASEAPRLAIVSVTSERELVEGAGYRYRRLTVADRKRPDDEDVERFVKLVRALPADSWVHFHCLDGRSRTTDFMILYDMLRNAGRLAFEIIRDRQLALAKDPESLVATSDWRHRYTEERQEFLQLFYDYAKSHPNGTGSPWREWLVTKK